MLDLNYVRENLDKVRAALQSRGDNAQALDEFEAADAERNSCSRDSAGSSADNASMMLRTIAASGGGAATDRRAAPHGRPRDAGCACSRAQCRLPRR